MDCWKCGKQMGDAAMKIGFRAVCVHCGRDLHVCRGCRYFAPGKPNDCMVPGTEFIRDREVFNFCEEFRPKLATPPVESQEKTRRLLGLDEHEKPRDFNSLFRDDGDV